MSVAIKWIVNLIRDRALNLTGNVLLYNSVRWFSHGAVLERLVAMSPHIISFLEEICHPVAKLDTQFTIGPCVLADIYGHLNKLSMLIQGRQKMQVVQSSKRAYWHALSLRNVTHRVELFCVT